MRCFYVLIVSVFFVEQVVSQYERHIKNLLEVYMDSYNLASNKNYTFLIGKLSRVQRIGENQLVITGNFNIQDLGGAYKYVKCTINARALENPMNLNEEFVYAPNYNEECTPITYYDYMHTKFENETDSNEQIRSFDGEKSTVEYAKSPQVIRYYYNFCDDNCELELSSNLNGVKEFERIAILHLNQHDSAYHSSQGVLSIKRQVQPTNGVKFIITLKITFNNCTIEDVIDEECSTEKICKVSILEKPWLKLSNSMKYRTVTANNCTEPWLFGDEGEEVPALYDRIIVNNKTSIERTIGDLELKELQEQIIPYERSAIIVNNANPVSSKHMKRLIMTEENKRAIDDMMNFFRFSNIDKRN